MRVPLIAILCPAVLVSLLVLAAVKVPVTHGIATRAVTGQSSPFIREYDLPARAGPSGITVDRNGSVWFVEDYQSRLAKLDPSTGNVETFQIPTVMGNSSLQVWSMQFDSQRRLWFQDITSNAIWSFNTSTLSFKEFLIPTKSSGCFQIALQPNSSLLWFTEYFASKIGVLDTSNGHFREYPVLSSSPTGNQGLLPVGIAFDESSGTVWFTEVFANRIGVFYPSNATFSKIIPSRPLTSPVGIALYGGKVWVTQHATSEVSVIDASNGETRSFETSPDKHLPDLPTLPYWIAVDRAGHVWFNEHLGNRIAEVLPDVNYSLVEYAIPTELKAAGYISGALTFTLDSHGDVWFTELFGDKIGELVPSIFPYTLSTSNESVALSAERSVSIRVNLSVNDANYLSTYQPLSIYYSDTETINGRPQNVSISSPPSIPISSEPESFSVTLSMKDNTTLPSVSETLAITVNTQWYAFTCEISVGTVT